MKKTLIFFFLLTFGLCFVQSKSIDDCNVEPNNTKITVYILNTNSKKFHYSSCSSVKQIKNENYKKYLGDRQELINMGYTACKRCNP